MDILEYQTSLGFTYNWCGKFISPSPDWVHLARALVDYELIVVTDGILYLADHRGTYTVSPGQYLLMPPTPTQYGAKASSCSFYWMHFHYHDKQNDHGVITLGHNDSESAPHFPAYEPGKILLPEMGTLTSPERITILMKQLQDSDRRYKEESLNQYLCGAILAEIAAQSTLYRSYGNQNRKEQIYQDIINYVSWHIHDPLRVSQIADYFGYNEKYITTFFKQHAGIPLKQYLLQAKMEHAKAALTETNQQVSQIAYGLGFSDVHNFTNAFKKIASLSPTEYRESYTKRNVFRK